MSPSAVEIRDATWMDVISLAPRLRESDVNESDALFGEGRVQEVVAHTFGASILRKTVDIYGVPMAMFGLALGESSGSPWMFGAPGVERYRRAFIVHGRTYIRTMLDIMPRLENVVDARNTTSIRWLKRLGFTVHPPVRMGAQQRLFHTFDMEV